MLGQQPGRMRARLTSQPMARPSKLADYLPQPRRVAPVHRRDHRLPLLHSVPGPQRQAGGLIPAGALQKFGAQVLIHRHHHPGPPITSARPGDRRMRTPCGANAVAGRPERTPDPPI
jgi:hypothetical protein